MRYPYYPHPELFEPSLETMKLWLNTRKSKTTRGGCLFETERYSIDRNWFLLAFIIEILAFFITIWGGFLRFKGSHSSKVLIIAIVASVLFVLLDYFGVLLHHIGSDNRAKANSQLNFEKDPLVIGVLKKIVNIKVTTYQFFGFLCFVLSAFFKITSLIILISFLKKLAPLITIFYLIVMYIHTKHTGYWYYAWKTKQGMNTEFNSFEKDRAKGMPSQYSVRNPPHSIQFSSFYKLDKEVSCLNDRVKILIMQSYENEGMTNYQYKMNCTGILWDNDIVTVTSSVNNNFQQDLLEGCVKLQHAQLGTAVAGMHIPHVVPEKEETT